MPQAVAEVEQVAAAVAWQRLAVLVEIGDVVEAGGGERRIFWVDDVAAARILALAEIERERHLLLVGDVLTGEQQHGVFVHAGLDVARLLRRQRLAQIDARNLAEKMRVKLPDRDRHGVSPGLGARLSRFVWTKNYSGSGRCQRHIRRMPRAPDAVQHECCEPGSTLLCM